jgi:AraC-like DNA-binding protein/quercetin dioxygenase-like cupin family protein
MSLQECGLNINHSQKELKPHGTLEFPCAGYASTYTNAPGDIIPWHWHEELEIVYIKKGTLKLQIPSTTYLMNAGDCAVINTNILHYAVAVHSCELHSLVFKSSVITGGISSVFYQKYMQPLLSCSSFTCIVFKAQHSDIARYFCKAFESLRTDTFGYEFTVREELSHICLYLYEHFSNQLFKAKQTQSPDNIRIEKMIDFIQNHYTEDITLSHIAESAGVGDRECLRCFKRTIGQSPIQYLLKYRLMQGANLLLTFPSLSISEIANTCGFDNPSYFSKMFKKFYICSPKEYRSS